MVRMTSRLLLVLFFGIICIPSFLFLYHSDEGNRVDRLWKNVNEQEDEGDFTYGVIMDAGSTGTRLFLYKWTSSSDEQLINIRPALDDVGKPVVKKVYPGLSTFAEKPNQAADYIRPLLDYAVEFIPEYQRQFTQVFLFATAGMRLVPEAERNAILHDLHTKLPEVTPMLIMKEHIRVIDGKFEGIYSWIAVNYILGNFERILLPSQSTDTKEVSVVKRKKTVGMIDMGGASCQIAYELPQNDTFLSENIENINLGSRDDQSYFKYKVYVKSFLGYGVNEGSAKYEQELSNIVKKENLSYVRDECLPVNLQKTVIREDNTTFVRKGIGNWKDCVSKLSSIINNTRGIINSSCQPSCFFGSVAAPNVSLSDMEIYGFSEYWYSIQDVLGLGGQYNHTHLELKANQFCSQRWSAIQIAAKNKLYPKADNDRLRTQCFKSAWVTAALHAGFSLKENVNQFKSANTIAGQEVQWALGAMIYHNRFFPLKNRGFNLVVNKHPDTLSSYPSPFLVLLFIFCFIICLYFIHMAFTRNPRVVGMKRNPSIWSYMAVPMEDSVSSY